MSALLFGVLLLAQTAITKPPVKPEAPKAISQADQLEYYGLRMEFAEAQVTRTAAKEAFAQAEAKMKAIEQSFEAWAKRNCKSPVVAADRMLTCPIPKPEVPAK